MTRNVCYAINIFLLALLFCPSLAEEELRGVKQKKYTDSKSGTYYIY